MEYFCIQLNISLDDQIILEINEQTYFSHICSKPKQPKNGIVASFGRLSLLLKLFNIMHVHEIPHCSLAFFPTYPSIVYCSCIGIWKLNILDQIQILKCTIAGDSSSTHPTSDGLWNT